MSADRIAYRPPEAGRLLGVGRNRIYELIASGEIPAVRLGSALLIPRVGLERWIADRARLESEQRRNGRDARAGPEATDLPSGTGVHG